MDTIGDFGLEKAAGLVASEKRPDLLAGGVGYQLNQKRAKESRELKAMASGPRKRFRLRKGCGIMSAATHG